MRKKSIDIKPQQRVNHVHNILAWISNYTHSKVWDDITYPFPNSNGCTVEVWEWKSNVIPHFIGHGIAMPTIDVKQLLWLIGINWNRSV